VSSKSSGGADSPRWSDRGRFKIIEASAPRRSRRMAAGSSACPLFQKPPADNERIMIDSMPIMAWRCWPDGFIEFLIGDGSNTLACPWTRRLDGDGLFFTFCILWVWIRGAKRQHPLAPIYGLVLGVIFSVVSLIFWVVRRMAESLHPLSPHPLTRTP